MISVILSIYNGEKELNRCVESLLSQTSSDYELILVDDGSTDRSGLICDDYASKYANVRVIHQENAGLSAARKTGYHEAKGDYLLFFDCDDYVVPNMIELLQRQILASSADLILYDYYLVRPGTEPVSCSIRFPNELSTAYDPNVFAVASIASGWNIEKEPYLAGFAWTRCVKKVCLADEVFISERLCYTEDVLFNLAISYRINTISYLKEPLYYYCVTANSLTNRYRENMWEMLLFRQKWIEKYCDSMQITKIAQNRIEKSWLSAVMISTDNVFNCEDYSLRKKVLKEICTFAKEKKIFSNTFRNWRYLSNIERVKVILLYNNFFDLYHLLKKYKK